MSKTKVKPMYKGHTTTIWNNENGNSMSDKKLHELDGETFAENFEFLTNKATVVDKLESSFDFVVPRDIKENGIGHIAEWFYDNFHDKYEADNSYNWGYYGPTFHFIYIPKAGISFFRMHGGGDVRGGYKEWKAVKGSIVKATNHWFTSVNVETNQGEFKFDVQGIEGYEVRIIFDNTGTFEKGETIKGDDLRERLEYPEDEYDWVLEDSY